MTVMDLRERVVSADPEAWAHTPTDAPDADIPAPEEAPDPDGIGDGAVHDDHILPPGEDDE